IRACAGAARPYTLPRGCESRSIYNRGARPSRGARTPIATTVRPAETDQEIGIGRRARRAYGFDEVALVPGGVTINPDDVDISFRLRDLVLPVPIWGSAMDGVVDVDFAIEMGRLGGLAVLNLDGVHTRYEDSRP